MDSKVMISEEEYFEYLKLKKIQEDAQYQVQSSIKDLEEENVYVL